MLGTVGSSREEADVRRIALVVFIVAGAAAIALFAGCGVRLSSEVTPTPSSTPAATPKPSPSATAALPTPSATPSVDPTALAAAVRRVNAAAAVKRVLPRFDELAGQMVASSGVPGAAVAIVAGDAAVYVRCFGVREVGRPERIDKDSLFQLGAVSKGFTSTMLAALVGEGEVGWDQPVVRAWPEFRLWDPWVSRHVSYRDLTAERSGLPAAAGAELVAFGYDRAEILARLRYLSPVADFRTAYAPQAAAYTVAAAAAERATGTSWAELVRSRILTPLDMRSTALTYRQYVRSVDHATPHVVTDGAMQAQMPPDLSVFAPSSGVSSSIAELVPYVRLHLDGGALGGIRVAAAQALAATHAPTAIVGTQDAAPVASALGWETTGYDGRLVVRQSGALAAGSGALVSLVPEDGVGIVVLANAFPEGQALARALTRSLLDLYTHGVPREDWYAVERSKLAAEQEEAAGDLPRALPSQAPFDAAPPRARSVYRGVYRNRYYGQVTVESAAGTALNVRLGKGEVLRYAPWSGDTWREIDSGTAAVFSVKAGRAVSVHVGLLAFDGRNGTFVRVPQ